MINSGWIYQLHPYMFFNWNWVGHFNFLVCTCVWIKCLSTHIVDTVTRVGSWQNCNCSWVMPAYVNNLTMTNVTGSPCISSAALRCNISLRIPRRLIWNVPVALILPGAPLTSLSHQMQLHDQCSQQICLYRHQSQGYIPLGLQEPTTWIPTWWVCYTCTKWDEILLSDFTILSSNATCCSGDTNQNIWCG